MTEPLLLVADKNKKIYDLDEFQACAQSGSRISLLRPKDLIPLPRGSSLFFLPDRYPVGLNKKTRSLEILEEFNPVTAFLPPGYTQTLSPAYQEGFQAKLLPLFSYTPVAYFKNSFHVPAIQIDRRKNHDMCDLDRQELDRGIRVFAKTENRLIRHLAGCARVNSCPNAINFFLGKYEAPLPVSPVCNARCMGCISFQPKDSCPATQPRLTFTPTPHEIAEVALRHIKHVKDAVVSFGQGCEGEPLMKATVIRQAIRLIRQATSRGTIHMNTNGSLPLAIDALCQEGLDSLRVSLNSAQRDLYERYYSPRHYTFDDVVGSIKAAKKYGKFVALNYLVMPGFTDRPNEFKALTRLIRTSKVDMIQWRNLNYDPQKYFRQMGIKDHAETLGIRKVISLLRKEFPKLRHGYFNVPQ